MPRRPALITATAALCAATALTACQGSPEAGHPNTTPTSTSVTPSPTPSEPSGTQSTPAWTSEQETAIAGAKARYVAAMAGIDKALADPTRPSRPTLEAAGLSDKRMVDAIADARSLRDSGWYRAGRAQIRSLIPSAVDLTAEQPKVTLRSCLDLSATVLRFQTDQKVVPISASSSKRVAFAAELRYATRPATSVKMWFLTDEKALGSC